MAPHSAVVHVSSAQALTERIDARLAACRDELATLDVEVRSVAPTAIGTARDLVGAAHVHGVVTLVDPARLVTAQWFSAIQSRRTWTLISYAAAAAGSDEPEADQMRDQLRRGIDPQNLVAQMVQLLGAENVTVVTTPRTDANELWERFCTACGLDEAPPATGRGETVELGHALTPTPLGAVSTELVRQLNELEPVRELDEPSYAASVTSVVARDALAGRTEPAVGAPDRYQEWAAAEADALISAVVSSGLEVVGELDELRPHTLTGNRDSTPTTTDLLAAAIDGLAGLVTAHSTLSERDPTSRRPSHQGGRRNEQRGARRLVSGLRHRILRG